MRWCFLCATEFPDGTRMAMAGGTNICLPCARTERGQQLTADPDVARLTGYRANQHTRVDTAARILQAMRRPGYYKRTYEREK